MSLNSSSNSSLRLLFDECHFSNNVHIFTALFITYILLLPLFIFILYLGFRQWWKQRSATTSAKTSHSDIFTFNMVALEMISLLGCSVYSYGVYTRQTTVMLAGMHIFSIISPAQTLFHLLTCVERYLAVIHPVTYRGLRRAGGVRIRNISIGFVWVLSFLSLGLTRLSFVFNIIYSFLFQIFSSTVVSVCSISVLCVLIHPGLGEVGRNGARVHQSKQRAFHTITAIMAALLLRFLSNLIYAMIYASNVLSYKEECLLGLSSCWFSLPSSLVLPLLFLHRAGKLPGCKRNTESG